MSSVSHQKMLSSYEKIIKDLLTTFTPRRGDALEMARNARVVLVENKDRIAIDIALGGFPFEVEAFERSVLVKIPHKGDLRIISPEDLVILKAFAARPHDWRDVESIIQAQGVGAFNTQRIFEILKMLSDLKDEPEIVEKLKVYFKE